MMSLYGDYVDNTFSELEEGVIGNIKGSVINIVDLYKQWSGKTKNFIQHKRIERYVTKSQKEAIARYYDTITDDDVDYNTYMKAFKAICKNFGISEKGTVIEDIRFTTDKNDKEQEIVIFRFSKGLVKVQIPKNVLLLHVSPSDDITELIPTFRSKNKGKYMYSSKRVYFTVARQISKFKGGNLNAKLTKYTPKEDYVTAYIDPTCASFGQRAVYIETNKPIPVVKIEKKFINLYNFNKAVDESVLDLEDIIEEEVVEEGFKEIIKQIKDWKVSNEAECKRVFKTTTLSDNDYDNMKEIFRSLHEDDYDEYKKSFDKLCRFCHIVSRGVIITKHELEKGKEPDKNTLFVEYSFNTKKIELTPDSALYHMSKVGSIKALEPTFRGKSERGYLYDKPRIYFTLNKNLPKIAADYKLTTKMYKYKCLDNIKYVYVDPLVRNKLMAAVYIETDKPVPVEALN